MPDFPGVSRPWLRGLRSKIKASTVTSMQHMLITDELGNLYVGDGTKPNRGLSHLLRSYKHPTLMKLSRGAEDVTIAALSDSTGQTQLDGAGGTPGTKRWPRLLCESIAALFPAYAVYYHEWSETENKYGGTVYPDVTIQAGTGTAKSVSINTASLASNVATLTATTPHGYQPGATVTVSGVGSPYDGTFTVIGTPTASTFTYAVTHADILGANVAGTVTSPYALHFYNGSISGAIGVGFLGVGTTGSPRYGPIIGNLNADLIFGSFGQNNALTDNDMQMASLWEQVTLDNPDAHVVLIAQNPNLNDARQAVHATTVERYARQRGFGFVDIHRLFVDAGTPPLWYVNTAGVPTDGVHPSILGSTAWAAEVFLYLLGTQFPQQQPSTLSTALEPLSLNGDFADVGTTFKSWTLTGGAVGVTSQVTWDRANSNNTVQKLTAPVANVSQYESQAVALPPSWRGKWVSLCARIWVPTVANGGSSTGGIITLSDVSQTVSAGAWGVSGKGAWVWVHLPMKITSGTSNVTVTASIYSEYLSNVASTTGFIYVDRAFIIPGKVLRDMPLRRNSVFNLTNIIARKAKWAAAEPGASGYQGVSTLAAGTVTVSATSIVTGDRVRLTAQSSGGGATTWGELSVTALTNATSFVITSSNASDTRQVLWEIIGNAN